MSATVKSRFVVEIETAVGVDDEVITDAIEVGMEKCGYGQVGAGFTFTVSALDPDEDEEPEPTTRKEWVEHVARFYGVDDDLSAHGEVEDVELDRYLLVERNVRGSIPPYWFTTHDSFRAIRRYHRGQEYAEDWEVEEIVDLDTGRKVDRDV